MTLAQVLDTLAAWFAPPEAPPGWRTCRLCQGTGHGMGSTVAHFYPCPGCDGKGIVKEG
jgi:hypothetical protein